MLAYNVRAAALVLLAACVPAANAFQAPLLRSRCGPRPAVPARACRRAPVSVAMFEPSFSGGATSDAILTALALNTALGAALARSDQRSLTPSGLANAWLLGVLLWSTLGASGWVLCVWYLIAGSFVTKVGMSEKEKLKIAEGRGGRRGPENVWGAAGAGTLCAIGTVLFPQYADPLLLGYVASISTKLSDTFASEIGKAFGKSTFLITTLRPVPRGTEGAVSLEGTAAGLVGSVLIALAAYLLDLTGPQGAVICLVSAFIATNIESVIGAAFQGDVDWLTNEIVNFIMTCIGAAIAIALRLSVMS